MAVAEFLRLLREAGFLAAVFVVGALAVILATIAGRRAAARVSPKVRDASLGFGLALIVASLGGYALSFQAGGGPPAPAPTATRPPSPPAPSRTATATPVPATPTSRPAEPTPTPPLGALAVSRALECDPPAYYGVRHCTAGAIHILLIDPQAERLRFETVLPQGYDRNGNFGECRDVSIPSESTGPGCQVRGTYPTELVGNMAERYPGAAAAFNADFFGTTHGPDGLTVKNGVRLDGVYGDHDEKEVTRTSLSISRAGDVRIGVVDRNRLPNPLRPWTWRPDPFAYYNSVGGIPLLVQDGEPVDIVRQCTIETSPDRSRCPPSEKRCDIGTRLYAGKCPDPNEQRARTAVGQAEDGQLIVLAVPETHGLTLYQLRDTFIRLGAVQAMNLDGGRSTQLWYDGDYVVTPTRPVASALLVFAQPRPPLAPPGGLFAVPVDGVSIRLTWTDNSANEDGFRIFRDGVQIATVRAGVTSFEDDDWDAGAIYRYTVRAYDSLGDSEDSNVAFVTVNVRR